MSENTKRVPAFWRVVRDIEGRKQWRHIDGVNWCMEIGAARTFVRECDAKRFADSRSHVVPVYVTVRQVKRGHDFAWALRQMKAGRPVTRVSTGVPRGLSWDTLQLLDSVGRDAFLATDWVLAESAP